MSSIKLENKYVKKTKSFLKKNIPKNKKEQKEKGGISESRLVNNNSNIQTIMSILKCKICKKILLNPFECSKCGNTFCYYCINNLKQNKLPCPFNCKPFEINPASIGLKKFLNQLKFECKYKKSGCKEIIPYNNIENHENNCPFSIKICPNAECKQKIKNNMLIEHIQNECPYTLFKCKNCGLNLNRKEILLHNKICVQMKEQLDSQSPIINKLTQEQSVKNNKDFNSFMNILNELNEDYFYLFDNKDNHKYYQNYSHKGLITLIKCLISLFQNKFGIIENKLNDIDNNLKKFTLDNSNIISNNNNIILDNFNKINEKVSENIKDIINDNKINKVSSLTQKNKINTKTISVSQGKKIENYNSVDKKNEWETTIKLDKSKFKIYLNNLYDKEKSIEFFHKRLKSNDIKYKNFEFRNNTFNENYLKNDLLIQKKENFKKKAFSRNKNNNIRQNMSFTNFIINKKRNIELKIMGNNLNRSSNAHNLSKLKLNVSNSFNKNNVEKTYEFNMYPKLEDKLTTVSDNKPLESINNNIYEKINKKNTFSLKSYKNKKM